MILYLMTTETGEYGDWVMDVLGVFDSIEKAVEIAPDLKVSVDYTGAAIYLQKMELNAAYNIDEKYSYEQLGLPFTKNELNRFDITSDPEKPIYRVLIRAIKTKDGTCYFDECITKEKTKEEYYKALDKMFET